MQRRTFMQGTLAGTALTVAVGAGLLTPRQVLAAWPKSAFGSKSVADAISGLYGSDANAPSKDISITAPDIAENGVVVPIKIRTSLSKVSDISVIVEKNGLPLAANFVMAKNAKGFIATRIKMAKTSNVIVLVKAGGKVHSARKEIKVTIGGCGG